MRGLGNPIRPVLALLAIFLFSRPAEAKYGSGSGTAIIATAPKFSGIIYETLKNNWIFEDFSNFVIANT